MVTKLQDSFLPDMECTQVGPEPVFYRSGNDFSLLFETYESMARWKFVILGIEFKTTAKVRNYIIYFNIIIISDRSEYNTSFY